MNQDAIPRDGVIRNQFGTFAGVFTPSILAILGVIMFMRAGFIVGEGGVRNALLILVLAEVIVVLTAISVAAIASNTRIRGGGAYYLISRVLGPEFGGAIGLTLFVAQAISVPFYILGFGEAFVQNVPSLQPYLRELCVGVAIALFVINYIGVSWALSAQFVIMTILGLSILSFVGGLTLHFSVDQLAANMAPRADSPYGFWVLFAIYFPAVTGIMAGINMSGDLRNPARSIIRGTLAAVGVGFVVYALQIILLGGGEPRDNLIQRPYGVLVANALFGFGFLVIAGMLSASISSAMSSFMAAPRVLQAIARDRLLRPLNAFARGARKGDEPRRATILAGILTVAILWLATSNDSVHAFNMIAALVTMFFLCTYTIINLAAFVEAFGSNPSFRPRFRAFHWSTALLGALACIVAMAMINLLEAVVATLIVSLLYSQVSRGVYTAAFGDARRGFVYSHISKNLLRLRAIRPHPKNWRPTILVLSGNPEKRLNLILFGVWLEAGRGIVTVAQLITGHLAELAERRRHALERIEQFIQSNDLNVFHDVIVAENFDEGVRVLLQGHSIGPIKPNIVLMGWPSDPDRVQPFVRHLRDIRMLGMSVLSVIDHGQPPPEKDKRIDIWWRGQENGSLMVILAHLLTRNWEWSRARIRIIRLVNREEARRSARRNLEDMVEAARIEADIDVIVSDQAFPSVFRAHSRDASVVLLGLQPPDEDGAEAFYQNTQRLLGDMPTTILVSSTGEADLLA